MHNAIPYLICHGSGNRFVMVDAIAAGEAMVGIDLAAFSRAACQALWPTPLDGLLLAVRRGEGFAMRMFNTDGSEAEMCGNGIRCVARLVRERYLQTDTFILHSGGKEYPITHKAYPGINPETFGVEIAIRLAADDFPKGGERFLEQPIPELHPTLRFSYLNLGNPHLVAQVQEVDFALLTQLGERIKELGEWFPRGMNLSFLQVQNPERLFVATYERGVGLTNSCGTAMTASTTVAVLLALAPAGREIEVHNRGGMVRCSCRIEGEKIATCLVGNATYEAGGELHWDGCRITRLSEEPFTREQELYNRFLASLQREQ